MLLTKQNLRKLYACFVKLPPFNLYPMPAPHKVGFGVMDTKGEVLGYFHTYPTRIEVDIANDSFLKVSETLMHEMIHCMLWNSGHTDYDKHSVKFKKYSKMVCDEYNFNLEEF